MFLFTFLNAVCPTTSPPPAPGTPLALLRCDRVVAWSLHLPLLAQNTPETLPSEPPGTRPRFRGHRTQCGRPSSASSRRPPLHATANGPAGPVFVLTATAPSGSHAIEPRLRSSVFTDATEPVFPLRVRQVAFSVHPHKPLGLSLQTTVFVKSFSSVR